MTSQPKTPTPPLDRSAADSMMDQKSLNEAVEQAVRRCLDASEPLVALQSFLSRLRQSGSWGEEEIAHVENATRRILAIIYEPSSAEDARAEDHADRRPE
jgi:hypothetical protein